MMNKTTIALALAVILAAASAAHGSKDDVEHQGGFHIGPYGQVMGAASTWRGRLRSVYAYAPRSRLNRTWYYVDDEWGSSLNGSDTTTAPDVGPKPMGWSPSRGAR